MTLPPGTRLGPYEIVAAIGSGGMGDVYKARDTRLDRTVAIKVLQQTGTDSALKILREARAAARLNHPNIATLHDVVEYPSAGPEQVQYFLVMEYVDGISLSALLASGPVETNRALDIAIQLTDALDYAHRKGIIHRDVKPANVLLTRDDKVKLLDLGIALSEGSDPDAPTRTESDLPVVPPRHGTPAYMAPEQLAGQVANARTDVYGAGVLLYELLTGRRPYDAPDRLALAIAVATSPTPHASALRPSVPMGVDRIVARAMARDPEARYGSAGELRDDLTRMRDLLRTGGPSAGDATTAPNRSRRQLALAIGAVALAAFALVAWMAVGRWRASAAPTRIAILPAANASEDPELDVLGASLVSILTDNLASAPGLTLVSANPGAYRGPGRDATKAAAELGRGDLIDLTLRKAGAAISVEAQLIEAGKTAAFWRMRYEGDALDVVRQVTEQLAVALKPAGLFRAGLTDEARARIRRLPTTDADAFAAYLRGRRLLEAAQDRAGAEQAVAAFEDATRRDPASALAQAGLSQAFVSLYSYSRDRALADKATAAAKQALELDPNRAFVREAVARAYQTTGQLENAERHAREAVRLAPDSDSARHLLALVLAGRRDIAGAVDEAREAIRLRPDYFNNHYTLGYILYNAGRYQEAIAPLLRTTELQPDSSKNFNLLGAAYHQTGQIKQAIGNYAQALRLGANAQAYSNLGLAYYAAGQFSEAADNYRHAIALDDASATTHRNLGDTLERLNKPNEARFEFSAAIARTDVVLKVNPQDAGQIAQKAFCEAKLGRLETAQQDIAAALTLTRRTNSDVMFKSAVVQALAGHPDNALQDLEDALKLGYPVVFAREDWDLRSLRALPKFIALVNARKDG